MTVRLSLLVLACWAHSVCSAQWSLLGTGMDHFVRALHFDPTADRLYAVGSFTHAGDSSVHGTAWWDGEHWHPMAGGLDDQNPAFTIAPAGDQLMMGGLFQSVDSAVHTRYLACWDGTAWHSCDTAGSTFGSVIRLKQVDSLLFACGGFVTLGGDSIAKIAYRSNGLWHGLLRDGFLEYNYYVATVARYQGDLYVGGNLLGTNGVHDIGKVVGDSLISLGAGIAGDPWVNDMVAYNGLLYVGGYFHAGAGNVASMLMCWDGQQWTNPFPQIHFCGQVKKFVVHDGVLYIAGPACGPEPGTYYGMLRYDGAELCILGGLGCLIEDMAVDGDQLYCATSAYPFGPDSLDPHFIASLDLNYPPDTCYSVLSGVRSIPVEEPFSVYPNPANTHITLVLPAGMQADRVVVYNGLGMPVLATTEQARTQVELNVRDLPPGPYALSVFGGRQVATARFIKD
jgi:Secretion system C-terminal sorting domain